MNYALEITATGTALLTLDDDVLWTSDGDDEFFESFDAIVGSADAERIIDWLCDNEYLPPDIDVEILDADDDLSEDEWGSDERPALRDSQDDDSDEGEDA